MKFGLLKSKIEKKLIESYNSNSFKTEVSKFKSLVLSDKEMGKMMNYYDELSSNKGLNESETNAFIDETLSMIGKVKVNKKTLTNIQNWVSSVKSKNEYKVIDDLISENLDISKRITLKKKISESLVKNKNSESPVVNLPLKSMVNIANQTLSKFLETLSESDKTSLEEVIKMKENEINENFNSVKKEVLEKLKSHLDICSEVEKEKITETISVVESKNPNKIEFYKLNELNKSL